MDLLRPYANFSLAARPLILFLPWRIGLSIGLYPNPEGVV